MKKLAWFFVPPIIAMSLATASSSPALRKKVLIIGIDGCRPDALLSANAPNLHRLIATGAFTDRAQTGARTKSGPGWSSLLTGVWADKHKVLDNTFKGARYDQFPHFFQRIHQFRPHAYLASVAHWSPIQTIVQGTANFTIATGSDRTASYFAQKTLRSHDPDVLFVHFLDVDHAGHRSGYDFSTGSRYLEAIATVDEYVGKVVAAVHARPTYASEDWLILVTTDHGGTGKSHGEDIPEHRTIFLIANGPSVPPGGIVGRPGIVDVPATALAHLGMPVKPDWNWDGKSIVYEPHPTQHFADLDRRGRLISHPSQPKRRSRHGFHDFEARALRTTETHRGEKSTETESAPPVPGR